MQTFKIFYSWQSDLPGNKTRNFIRECIDEAIELAQETETIEAERDEATMGTTGSPDIVATLFSKIDNCDLFIADLSFCFTEDLHHNKKSPNPNVMVELGYAVKTLGWEILTMAISILSILHITGLQIFHWKERAGKKSRAIYLKSYSLISVTLENSRHERKLVWLLTLLVHIALPTMLLLKG